MLVPTRYSLQNLQWGVSSAAFRPLTDETMPKTKPSKAGEPDGKDTFRYWLLRTLKEMREEHDFGFDDVAHYSGVHSTTVGRFDEGSWPREIDQILAAYGLLSKMEDPRDIWNIAWKNYKKLGAIPSAEDANLSPAARAARLSLEASQRRKPKNPPQSNTG